MIPTIPAKTIVSARMKSGWFGAAYNMNIYKGCCHGCIYCDSRSACYGVENFDTVRAKENALAVIESDLRRKRKGENGRDMLIMGAMSDPYNPFEKECALTRGALALAERYGFGMAIDTKSPLVLRDLDLLTAVARHAPVSVSFTITTLDDTLCRKLETAVAPSSERFAALAQLAQAGIPCGVLLMPVLPFINDNAENILGIVRQAHKSGAKWVYCGYDFGVTLRQNQREHFYQKLDTLFPGLKQRYIRTYGDTYSCPVPNHDALWRLFAAECRRLGLLTRMGDIRDCVWEKYGQNRLF